ncbi:hypothetical protein A3Q34_14735 [Colwellia sp. PAMC 20917]|jgi:hypothetical protein|uniref:DUF2750 domain-containing protein n=1 Tax=unclassified Colwellia TaxID=196834 RepID=UPI0008786007|nr:MULTISPECIES: DUF2750 domain-containing protein [unclassified Colwellia]MBA6364526.1 DUF2750 domain-containing protein [Colwellia sp. BRX8-8]AOW77986.1 hypothetical protein A3Q34_14735 [Colwellia sp. PAMC 20917]MBA6337206.1 DUF2750 domain-containing protein [Colwellia sp. BRX8-7]MBA6347729.1 DUF2750 domain-containing protein [Colwellia sp. BRX8-9]MBA6353848.1 DUF2750 domain-containing protein [Colwellia sp. BRX9-1]|tara:strand:+ start:7501 stop:7872 length:372 start_codon:yes stop_codon:yes gene_type:complete
MNSTILSTFLVDVKNNQSFWALQEKSAEDWVVLDSINFENTEVMPLWSSQELAQKHCVDEWQEYVPTKITLSDWLEFWLEDLSEDGVIVGINWQEETSDTDDNTYVELDLAEFSQALAEIEAL